VASTAKPAAAAVVWFPVVGAVVGATVALLDGLLSLALPVTVVVPLSLVALALLSGGLHLDGLADSADGLLGGGDPERRLAVMRDPHVGAFAVVAIALVLLVDATALASAPSRARALWLAAVCSRWAMALAIWAFPSARPDGLGASFRAGTRGRHALAATAWVLALALPFGLLGAAAVLAAAAAAAIVGARAVRVVGGATGDVYGAVSEIAFAGVLVAEAALA
jgi:adenosylcobinamide-GDP ribazoletransferase